MGVNLLNNKDNDTANMKNDCNSECCQPERRDRGAVVRAIVLHATTLNCVTLVCEK